MVRIYSETVKKWAVGAGITGVSMVVLIFAYLQFIGAITITGVSGDSVCMGTVEEPCYAYINFTANKDVFLYPLGHDPWGRNTPFTFDPAVKSWRLQRSWGSSWRTVDLEKTWNKNVKYAIKFAKGQDYQIRIVAVKESPLQTIKWFSDDWKVEDPLWIAAVNLSFKKSCNNLGADYTTKKGDCVNVIKSYNVICNPLTDSCLMNKTKDYYKVVEFEKEVCEDIIVKKEVCRSWDEGVLVYDKIEVLPSRFGMACFKQGSSVCCRNIKGDSDTDEVCRYGENCACYDVGKTISYSGTKNQKSKLKSKFDNVGII